MQVAAKITACLLLTAFAASTQAADFGARIGVGSWGQDFSGDFDSTNTTVGNIDLQQDLGLGTDSGLSYYVVLEHPLGAVPNIKIQHTDLETDGITELERSITYDGLNFDVNQEVLSIIDLSHDDVNMYWQPIQGRFNLGLGLTVRIIDGSFAIRDLETTDLAIQRIDEAIPIPYFQANYTLGNSGFAIGADVNAAAFDGDKFIDTHLRISWQSSFGLGVEVGHRSITIDIQDIGVEGTKSIST